MDSDAEKKRLKDPGPEPSSGTPEVVHLCKSKATGEVPKSEGASVNVALAFPNEAGAVNGASVTGTTERRAIFADHRDMINNSLRCASSAGSQATSDATARRSGGVEGDMSPSSPVRHPPDEASREVFV